MNNYYQDFWKEIQILAAKKPWQALIKLEKELSMPYIPSEQEQKFRTLQLSLLQALKNKKINNNLSKQEIFQIFFEKTNSPLVGLALQQLREINLQNCLTEIQKLFAKKEISNVLKSIIYEYLVQQKINHHFVLNKHSINPFIDGGISTSSDFIKIVQSIESLTFKNPNLQKIAVQNFENVVLKIFPRRINYQFSIARVCIFIANEMLASKDNLILKESEKTMYLNFKEIINQKK